MERSKKNKFEAAKKKRQEQREKEDNRQFGEYEEIVYTALPKDQDKVVRIVGDPLLVREKPTDPKLSYISMILGDNDKKFRCIWPDKSEDPSWILWKIYDKVLSYDWDRANNVKRYHHVESHPEVFRRVAKNNSENQFEQGWKPSKFVHMNVIDRHDMDFHREERHLKVLSKKASESGDRIFYEPGIPEYLYSKIWDDVVEYNGDWHNYDVVLRKKNANPWYEAFHAIDDRKKIQTEAREFIVEGDITEEELSWEGYDFDKLFPITSYSKIKNRLSKFIQMVDISFDTKYFQELEELVAIEEQGRKEDEENSPKKSTPGHSFEDDDEEEDVDLDLDVEEEPEEAPVRTRKASRKLAESSGVDWDGLIDGSFNGTEYAGVAEMTEEEKGMVVSVNEDGSFEYVKIFEGEKVTLLKNPSSDFISPEQFHIDPLSGELFE